MADFQTRLATRPIVINFRLMSQLNDFDERLLFAWLIDKAELILTFNKLGLSIITPKDLDALSQAHHRGLDISGSIRNKNGQPIFFSASKIINNIVPSKHQVTTALNSGIIKPIYS